MDLSFLLDFIDNIPSWVWIIAGLWFAMKYLGDKKKWEYEVDFPYLQGVGKGEIEFKCYEKKGISVEVELDLASPYKNKPIEVFLNDDLVFVLPPEKNNKSRVFKTAPIALIEPSAGDEVVVKVEGESKLRGTLKRD